MEGKRQARLGTACRRRAAASHRATPVVPGQGHWRPTSEEAAKPGPRLLGEARTRAHCAPGRRRPRSGRRGEGKGGGADRPRAPARAAGSRVPAGWPGRGCPHGALRPSRDRSPRARRASEPGSRADGAEPRRAGSPWRSHDGVGGSSPGWGRGKRRAEAAGRRARCVLRSCVGAFLSQELAGEGEGPPLRLLLFAMLTQSINSGTKGPTSPKLC